MKAVLFATATTIPALLVWAYGCGSSDSGSTSSGTFTRDAGDARAVDALFDADAGIDTGIAETGAEAAPAEGAPPPPSGLIQQKVNQTNLFADTADGGALHVDPRLVNPWGLAFNPTAGIAWVADNKPGLVTLYATNLPTPLPLVVTIPPPPSADAGSTAAPTGQVFNPGAVNGDFKGDQFIICTEDGTVVGWNSTVNAFNEAGKSTATIQFDNSAANANYKGLAIVPSTPPHLLVADFHNARVEVLDTQFNKITDGGSAWTDPSVPAGYAPFNIVTLRGSIYIAYAKQKGPDNKDGDPGPGNGALSVFNPSGALVKSLVKVGDALNAPWGVAFAPSNWGQLGGTLIVGNFGDGHVNAYDPTSGAQVGTLVTSSGSSLVLDGLWSLVFGVNVPDAGVTPTQLYFTSGPNEEMDGLYGFLTPQ